MRGVGAIGWGLAACSEGATTDATDPPATCPGPVTAELGQGDVTFVPLTDMGTVSVVHGPQGGFHVDVSASVTGYGATVQITGTVSDASTGTVVGGVQAPSVVALQNYDPESCSGVALAIRLFLDDLSTLVEQETAACALGAGGIVELAITITDLENTNATTIVTAQGIGELSAPGGSPCP